MGTPHTAAAKPKMRGPVSQVLDPIRGRLLIAALLAGVGAMLTLVPLAGIAHVAGRVMGDNALTAHEVWWAVGAGVASLCAGMLLISAGELLAHLADNRITHHPSPAPGHRAASEPRAFGLVHQPGIGRGQAGDTG